MQPDVIDEIHECSLPGFIVEHDIWQADELDTNPTYRDFLRPGGSAGR